VRLKAAKLPGITRRSLRSRTRRLTPRDTGTSVLVACYNHRMDKRVRSLSAIALVISAAMSMAQTGPVTNGKPAASSSDTVASSGEGAGSRPNIVLITLCSCRLAHLGFAGYDRDTTPFLDSLADGGVVFENMVAASSWTKPTVSSILTGLTPNVHQMSDYNVGRDSFKRTLNDEVVTLADCLTEAGYATFWRSNNPHATNSLNMAQGFDSWTDWSSKSTADMLQELAGWLSEVPESQPFFCFILTRDAHLPYSPEHRFYQQFNRSSTTIPMARMRPHAMRFYRNIERLSKSQGHFSERQQTHWIDLYDAVLRELDTDLSRIPEILQGVGRQSNTLIVVTGDHGERMFDAHGAIGHAGGFLSEPIVDVPLIMYGAGMPAGSRIANIVRSIDIFPTVAALAGVDTPEVIQGSSLLPLVHGNAEWTNKSAFASFNESSHIVRRDRYKLHRFANGSTALYDVEKDPDEVRTLEDDLPELAAQLQTELDRWLTEESALREVVASGEKKELSEEELSQLRALGYIE
jgi:arylsulfatase A-like enzyme